MKGKEIRETRDDREIICIKIMYREGIRKLF